MKISKYKIAWLVCYFSIATFSATIITPALPAMQVSFNLRLGEVDWVVSVFLMGYVFGQLLYGPIASKWGSVFSLRLGLIINLIGILVCLLGINAHAFWALLMGRILSALGAASGLACVFMLINEHLLEPQQKTAIAYSVFSFTLGMGLAITLGGIITEYWHWSGCFIILFIHGLIMYFGTYVFHNAMQPIQNSTLFQGYKTAIHSQTLVIFSLAVGFSTAITYCYSTAAPQIAKNLLHLSSAAYGYWNLLNVLGMLIGGLWSKHLLQKFSATKVFLLGLILCIISISSFMLLWQSRSASILWFFGNAAFMSLFGGLVYSGGSYIASHAIHDKANASSMMSFINLITATLAVIIMPWLSVNTLLAFSGILASLWLLVFVLIGYWLYNTSYSQH